MTLVADHYEVYYADKLWNLLPAVYRALDTDDYSSNGPLREMVNRIGAQAAVLRRSIDRIWEDQSIETCDDWLIPYIGDLVATNLVPNLDGRSQRLDVARTIYYRRRKGTVGVLEELAYDITGWNAKVVEFFRLMGRTRHGLDPQIGLSLGSKGIAALQQAEGIVGTFTGTPIGGTADLRKVYGASKVGTAFDEFFHTADFRLGRGMTGWYNIPRLGVFLWRLYSFSLPPTTPVAVAGCPNWFTFDPTGRDVPLFAQQRSSEQYGKAWVSPSEQQLPGPISQGLYDANIAANPSEPADQLYPGSLQVLSTSTPKTIDDVLSANDVTIRPQRGRFKWSPPPSTPTAAPSGFWTTYHYGFSSTIGAGPYDRRLVRSNPMILDPHRTIQGGADNLTSSAMPSSGTLTIGDSLTYVGAGAVNVSAGMTLTIVAGEQQRPLIRFPSSPAAPADWIITGNPGCSLVLDGLLLSGGDVVLQGSFQSVSIVCCTLDPGTAGGETSPPAAFATSADGRPLAPTRLWVEAQVEMLTISYSITGPVQPRSGGAIQTLCINDSILQAIAGSAGGGMQVPLSPPEAPADTVLFLEDGLVCCTRCTILGQIIVHQLQASDCILHDLAVVDDTQHGWVRFSAWMQDSVLPSKYESVQIPAGSAIFTATDYGDPGYCQLLATADQAVIPDLSKPTQNTISAGADNGSEMGAFAGEQNPIKQRGLLIKYQEYMPAGLVPVIVFVT